MKMSKIKKLPMLFALVITIVSSLLTSTFAFADVTSGPNNEYCTITHISGNGNSWNSTPNNPQYAAKSTVGTDVLGNTGGIPVMLQYSAGCVNSSFCCVEVDSKGVAIGSYNITPQIKMTPQAAQCSTTTQYVQLPSSWFTAGKEYKIYSFGIFPSLSGSQCPSSTAFVEMLN
ncbi:hypothetical protein [Clostridium estertheticum]|uniref:Secreted protein n=1 Tax=Clostridium estertheticum TaxID=238834 RepID=A0AA47EHN6_9CLOT|nr:hypothetical protein [Clostridium estertheticum]MBU3155345.1 hypothetical protein [Clostridium estertheticum]WAG60403.1 hypothetical protein LL038_23240 [Clostridium estertheticum]